MKRKPVPAPKRKGRIAKRREKAVAATAKATYKPALVLSAAAVLECAHVGYLPWGWMTLSAMGCHYGKEGLDAVRVRRSGGKRAARQRRRYQGTATSRELKAKLSLRAARKRAKVTRPSLGGRVRGLPANEVAVAIATAGTPSRTVYGTHEDVYGYFGIARRGKTGALACRVLDAPGACVAFTTRSDLRDNTVMSRAERGPICDLDPDPYSKVETNFGLSPLDGCWMPSQAGEAAGYFIHAAPSDKGGSDAHWDGAGCDLLRLMLHAAALTPGATMCDVAAWSRDPKAKQPLATLASHELAAPGWAQELYDLAKAPGDYLDGVIAAAKGALRWMSDPLMAAIACPEESGLPVLDPVEFLFSGGTLYVTATDRPHNSMAPYNAWLCARIFDTLKRVAANTGELKGRMDPPLTLVGDEVAQTCPAPWDRWAAEAGGWGAAIALGFQSRSQMTKLWEDAGAQTVWNNIGVKLIFGGFTHDADLKAFSDICGPRDTWHHVKNGDGTKGRQPGTEPLFSPERIRLIGDKGNPEVLVVHHKTRVFLAEPDMVWNRPGYVRAEPGWTPAGPVVVQRPAIRPAYVIPEPQPAIEPAHREAIATPYVPPAGITASTAPISPLPPEGDAEPAPIHAEETPQWLSRQQEATSRSVTGTVSG